MSHPDEFESDIPPVSGLYWGIVTDNADPARLGRVRLTIPGLIEPQSGWVSCAMLASGTRRGFFALPGIGTTVVVGFILGDLEEPVVLGAVNPPDARAQEAWADVPAEKLPNVFAITLGRYSIVIDANVGQEKLYIRDEGEVGSTNPNVSDPCMIVFDGVQRTLSLKGQVGIDLKSTGLLGFDGAQAQLQGRVVLRNGQSI